MISHKAGSMGALTEYQTYNSALIELWDNFANLYTTMTCWPCTDINIRNIESILRKTNDLYFNKIFIFQSLISNKIIQKRVLTFILFHKLKMLKTWTKTKFVHSKLTKGRPVPNMTKPQYYKVDKSKASFFFNLIYLGF